MRDAVPKLGVGMLGHGFMGGAHSRALGALRMLEDEPAALPELVSVSGRDRARTERARTRYGWAESSSNWHEQLADPRVVIFVNVGPNHVHLEPCLEAIRSGKAVVCEKPLGRSADEAWQLACAAAAASAVTLCGYNFRFLPAVRLARELISSRVLGPLTHFRGRFLASSALNPDQEATWRFRSRHAGSGTVADLGSHLIDLARHLVGEPNAVAASVRTFVEARRGERVDVDDAFVSTVEFDGGALGALEASRAAGRRSNEMSFQVDGESGSLSFDVDRLNELRLISERKELRTISVTGPGHPFMELWWPAPGHAIGWGESFVHEWRHTLAAVAAGRSVSPHGADFEDGYRCAEVCAAILRSAASGRREQVRRRALQG